MRPFVTTLPSTITGVSVLPDGVACTLHGGNRVILGPDLSRRAELPYTDGMFGDRFELLADGRYLCASQKNGFQVVGAGRTALERSIEGYVDDVVVTPTGYAAIRGDRMFIDAGAGTGRWIDLAPGSKAIGRWRDRFIVGREDGLVTIDATGATVTRNALLKRATLHAIVGDRAVISSGARVHFHTLEGLSELFWFDELEADQIRHIVGHDGNPVIAANDSLTYWLGTEEHRWSHELEGVPHVAGDWIAIGGDRATTRIIVAATGEIIEHPLDDLSSAVAFGGGIVLVGERTVWWRPGEPDVELLHDIRGAHATLLPHGLVTTEDCHLYLWRLDADGPEATTVATTMPLDRPLIVDGEPARALERRRFAVRGERYGHPVLLDPAAPWRQVIAASDARAIVDRLLARDVEGELPELPTNDQPWIAAKQLARLPLDETTALQARAWFAPKGLPPPHLAAALHARAAFVAELATALELQPRVLSASIVARKLPLVPPQTVVGHDYLGSFVASAKVWVADPCYFNKRSSSSMKWLAISLDVRPGLWHAFVRNGTDADTRSRTAELVAIHDQGFGVCATENVGRIGVDSGCAGIWDDDCPRRDVDALPFEEGIYAGRAALSWSGYGDGGYEVYAGRLGRDIAKLRIGYLDGTVLDRSFAAPVGGKKYSPKTRFALGESLEHPTFGAGTVTAVQPDGKIAVAFADGPRTLVHART